jgi:hypothetical protein
MLKYALASYIFQGSFIMQSTGTVATQSSEPTTVRKVTVNFAPETYETLASVAKARNVTMSEALRQSIGLMAFVVDELKSKHRILVDRNGQVSELRIL